MKKLILGWCIAATFALLGGIGCADAEYALTDSVQEEGGEEVSAIDEGERQPYFSTAKNLNGSFLSEIHRAASVQNSSSIQYPFCIYTIQVPQNTQTENNVLAWATKAMNQWIAPLQGQPGWKVKQATAYKVQNCPSTHNGLKVYTIEISNLDGADNTCPGFNMRMGNWGIHEYVVTHEMGHGIGMGDTYKYPGGTHTPIGQPAAVMNNNWAVKGVLQRDDIDGIRHLWARLRGGSSACPAGYKTGDCIGSSCSYANFCVPTGNDPGEDPVDSCPNDPNKTSPGQCGCGVAEGTCAGTCTDNHSKCAYWASIGECKKNPDYMRVNCKKSCNQCSSNTDQCPNDPNKTKPGQCGCGKVEGTCSGTCTDNHSKCAYWASIGECKKNPDYMLVNCKKSCNQC